jgi:hypothetical protein
MTQENEQTGAPAQDAPQVEVTTSTEPEIIEIQVEDGQESPAETVQEAAPVEEKKPFNPKTDKVEFDKPEQQERFNEVFRQLKKSDQRNEMLTDFLKKQSEIIDTIRSERNQTNEVEAERAIMSRIQDARANGDDAAYDKAFSELTSYRAEKIFEKKINDLSRKEADTAQQQADFVVRAMEERGEDGNYRRPWLQENNPDFGKALYEIQRIAKKYEGNPDILNKTLAELDQVMGNTMTKKEPPKTEPVQQPQTRAPNPMQGSNLTNHKPRGTIKMTKTELSILQKLEEHSGRKINKANYATRRDSLLKEKGGR